MEDRDAWKSVEQALNSAQTRTRTSAARTRDNLRAAMAAIAPLMEQARQLSLSSTVSGSSGMDSSASATSLSAECARVCESVKAAAPLNVARDDHRAVHAALRNLSNKVSALLAPSAASSSGGESCSVPTCVCVCECQTRALVAACMDTCARKGLTRAAEIIAEDVAVPLPMVSVPGASGPRLESLLRVCVCVCAHTRRIRAGDTLAARRWLASHRHTTVSADSDSSSPCMRFCGPRGELAALLALVHMCACVRGRVWVEAGGEEGPRGERGVASGADEFGEEDAASVALHVEEPRMAGDIALAWARSCADVVAAHPAAMEKFRKMIAAAVMLGGLGDVGVSSAATGCDAALRLTPYGEELLRNDLAEAAAEMYLQARLAHVHVSATPPLATLVDAGRHALPMLQRTCATLRLPADLSFNGTGPPHYTGTEAITVHPPRQGGADRGRHGARGHADDAWTCPAAALEIPFDAPMPDALTFHSVFSCPVTRQPAHPDTNPPCLLPCGHVISREAVQRLAAARSRFKCPTCPAMCTAAQLVEIKLE